MSDDTTSPGPGRYRRFVERSGDAFWHVAYPEPIDPTSPTGDIVAAILDHAVLHDCNEACARLVGAQSRHDLIGETFATLIAGQTAAFHSLLHRFVDAGFHLEDVDHVFAGGGGDRRTMRITMEGEIEGEALVGAWGAWRDVTDALDDAHRLRRYRTHLELAQSVAGFGSWEFDPLHQEFLASDQAWRLAGIAAPESPARVEDWLACVHDIDRDRVSAQVFAAFDRVEPFDVEFRVIWPDGSVKWQEARAHLVGGDGDEPPRLIGVTIDITDRKQVELHLLFRNDFQRLISSLSTEFIHVAPQHLDRAFQTALERVGQFVHADACVLAEAQRDERPTATSWWLRSGVALAPMHEQVAAGRTIYRHVERGEPLYLSVAEGTRGPLADHVRALGVRTLVVLPVEVAGAVVGAVALAWIRIDRRWSPDELTLLRNVGQMVSRAVERRRTQEEVRRVEAEIRRQATYDALTDLPNRVLAMDRLGQALRAAGRHGGGVGLMFIDLDDFKKVNDTLGHDTGDALLRQAAERLQMIVRDSDTIARLGGDEFLIILPNCSDPADAEVVATKVLGQFSWPFEVAGREAYVSASIGVTLAPFDGTDPTVLLRNADAAMYRAKARGRNTYHFYTAEMNEHAQRRMQMESELRRALNDNTLRVFYQPLVDLASGTIAGAEALLRWDSPSFGPISPEEFIPLAEHIGIIGSIGEWVLGIACQRARAWRETHPGFRVAVNVSTRQFKREGLVDAIRAALDAAQLDAGGLEVEVTESVVLDDAGDASRVLAEIGALGTCLTVDDFGTGYSSLSYLTRFPFARLKIDRSFVRGLPDDESSAALVDGIIALAHSLSIGVTGEGVETEEQMAFLRERGCNEAQGFLFGEAVDAEAFEALLASGLPTTAAWE